MKNKTGKQDKTKNMQNNKIQCPNCDSYKTMKPRNIYGWGGLVLTILSIPWAFMIVGLLPLIAGIILAVAGFFGYSKNQYKCRNCKNEWEHQLKSKK